MLIIFIHRFLISIFCVSYTCFITIDVLTVIINLFSTRNIWSATVTSAKQFVISPNSPVVQTLSKTPKPQTWLSLFVVHARVNWIRQKKSFVRASADRPFISSVRSNLIPSVMLLPAVPKSSGCVSSVPK